MIAKFENDVKLYGTQTVLHDLTFQVQFENDVKMYGTQTKYGGSTTAMCLRMM